MTVNPLDTLAGARALPTATLALLLAGLVLVGCRDNAAGPAAPTEATRVNAPEGDSAAAPTASAAAPDFELTAHDGSTVRLSDLRGKIVVLEWFNEQCPFVVRHHDADHRTMVKLAQRYADQDVVWLAVNSSHFATPQTNAAAAAAWDIPYPILDDSAGDVGRAYGARTTPHMFVIDRQGVLVYQGAIDDDPGGRDDQPLNYVDQTLAELLAGEGVSITTSRPYGCSVKYQ